MNSAPPLDVALAHRYFAASCFNGVWDLLDRPHRTPDDDIRMVAQAQASLWHWLERADRTPRNLSVGYWQVSRVYAVLGDAAEARRYAELCLAQSGDLPPFFLGYAHEALARAARLAGDARSTAEYVRQARNLASQVAEADERRQLVLDLDALA